MANLTGNLKDSMTATFPREFDIPNAMTIQEIYDKLNAHAAAFQMPFFDQGRRSWRAHRFLQRSRTWMLLSGSTSRTARTSRSRRLHRAAAPRSTALMSVRTALCARASKGVASRPMLQGQYIDGVTDTIKKILADEGGCGLCDAGSRARRGQALELANAPAAVHLRRRCRNSSLLCRQDRHGRSLSVHRRSVRHRLARGSYQKSPPENLRIRTAT